MADKQINELPAIPQLTDDSLIPVYVPGSPNPAQALSGKQFKAFAVESATAYAAQAKSDADRAAEIAVEMDKLATQVGLDAATASQAKADALTAQGKAETAQAAAETARQAAEDAATKAGNSEYYASACESSAQIAANQAAYALSQIQMLYQDMKTYVAQAIQDIQTAGDTQVERVTAEGTAQVNAVKEQADRGESAADRAEDARSAAEALAYLTDEDDGTTTYTMAWSVKNGFPVLTLKKR